MEVANLDTTATISDLAGSQRHDQFIPVRKEDLFSALIKQGDLADPAERELFGVLRVRCARSVTTNIPRRSIGCAALPPKADIGTKPRDVRFGSITDIEVSGGNVRFTNSSDIT